MFLYQRPVNSLSHIGLPLTHMIVSLSLWSLEQLTIRTHTHTFICINMRVNNVQLVKCCLSTAVSLISLISDVVVDRETSDCAFRNGSTDLIDERMARFSFRYNRQTGQCEHEDIAGDDDIDS